MTCTVKPSVPLALGALLLSAATAGAAQEPTVEAAQEPAGEAAQATASYALRKATDPNVWVEVMQQLMRGQSTEGTCVSCHEPQDVPRLRERGGHGAGLPMVPPGMTASPAALPLGPMLMPAPLTVLLNPMFTAGMAASFMSPMAAAPGVTPPAPPVLWTTPGAQAPGMVPWAPQPIDQAEYERMIKEWSEGMAERVREAQQLAPGAQKEAESDE